MTYVIELRGGYSQAEALEMLGIKPYDNDEVCCIARRIVDRDPETGSLLHAEFLEGEPRLCSSGPSAPQSKDARPTPGKPMTAKRLLSVGASAAPQTRFPESPGLHHIYGRE